MTKANLIRLAPFAMVYLAAVALFIFMLHEKPNNILTGLMGVCVAMPLIFGMFFGFAVWAKNVEDKESGND